MRSPEQHTSTNQHRCFSTPPSTVKDLLLPAPRDLARTLVRSRVSEACYGNKRQRRDDSATHGLELCIQSTTRTTRGTRPRGAPRVRLGLRFPNLWCCAPAYLVGFKFSSSAPTALMEEFTIPPRLSKFWQAPGSTSTKVSANSIRTGSGTIIKSLKESYVCSDWGNFKQFVLDNKAVELFQQRIHQTNFKEFLSNHADFTFFNKEFSFLDLNEKPSL